MTKHRSRGAAAVITTLAVAATGAVLANAPAQSLVVGDCAEPFPVVDVTRGMLVNGKTVSQETTPDPFTGQIIEVLDNGIAPGLDMVIAELDSPAIADAGGIWAGMSGSPVYAEDGRLIGAVAYGLAFGTTPVAGITPFEAMDDWFASAPPTTLRISKRQARTIAAATDVSTAQAERGFEQLPMHTALSGVTAARLRQMKQQGPSSLRLQGVRAARAASAATAAAGAETLVAGGNLGAAYSYGDITAGGVGTVTSVCNNELVGFGHPLDFVGRTTAGIMPADALYVQRDPLGVAFKVATMGEPAGTLTQDRLTGISGLLETRPDETHVTSRVAYRTRERSGTSHSLRRDFNANVAFAQALATHDVTIAAIQGGTDTTGLTITGEDADGRPFSLAFSDRYTSRSDVSFFSVFDTADLVFLLSRMRGVTVIDVNTDSRVTDSTRTWRLDTVEQRRGAEWVRIGRRSPVLTRAGGTIRLRATLVRGPESRVVPLTLAVPNRTRPFGALGVRGGASLFQDLGRPTTPAELADTLAGRTRNDQVQAELTLPRRRAPERVVTDSSAEQTYVVRGRVAADVLVRR